MTEEREMSKKYKQEYLDGLEALISRREQAYEKKRDSYIRDIFKNPEFYRDELKSMFGYPLTEKKPQTLPKVKTEPVSDGVVRMSFEILEDVWMTGLFFQKDEKKRPLVIVQHGGLGTPEFISNFYDDTANYNHMLERVVQYDVHAFAPQLLIWSQEEYQLPFNRQEIDARLKRVGSSVTAVEVYGIMRILDWFEAQDYVKNFGMVGLSYGGFYTLTTTALEPRIQSAVSCSYFNDRTTIGWTDWTWENAAEKFFDAEIACLAYPRRLCIEVGNKDELFNIESAKKEWERLKKLCAPVGTDWVDFIEFDGDHEFCKSDEPIKRLADDLI